MLLLRADCYPFIPPRPLSGRTSITTDGWICLWVMRPLPPATALNPSVKEGQCWPSNGTSGYLGIQLSSSVQVSGITIGHVSAAMADVRAAPHSFIIWCLVEQTSASITTFCDTCISTLPDRILVPAGMTLIPLDFFEYNIHLTLTDQAFDISTYPLAVHSDKIILEILDNWGSESYTCLYSVRIHGRPLD